MAKLGAPLVGLFLVVVKRLDVAFRLDVELRVACSSRRGRWLVIVWWVLVQACVLIYIWI